MEIGANATLHVALKDIGIDTMMPENTVDAVAFWIIIGIFAVIFGNLIFMGNVMDDKFLILKRTLK